jgi:phosphoribosylformimino-5-aminoimidazole carboxamide ribotide isomerase
MLEETGLSRVIVGTKALKDPDWFRRMAERYPHQLVLGIDARDSYVATEGWLDISQTKALELARQYAGLPLAAVVYTNIANDGMLAGIDQATIDDLIAMANLGLNVIASGGVSSERDIANLALAQRQAPTLVGAIAGRALYEGRLTLAGALEAARRPARID